MLGSTGQPTVLEIETLPLLATQSEQSSCEPSLTSAEAEQAAHKSALGADKLLQSIGESALPDQAGPPLATLKTALHVREFVTWMQEHDDIAGRCWTLADLMFLQTEFCTLRALVPVTEMALSKSQQVAKFKVGRPIWIKASGQQRRRAQTYVIPPPGRRTSAAIKVAKRHPLHVSAPSEGRVRVSDPSTAERVAA